MGQYGPGPGPFESEALQEKNTLSYLHAQFYLKAAFYINTTFFDSFNVFFRFQAEISFITIMKLPQKASVGTKTCSFGTSITLPQEQSE